VLTRFLLLYHRILNQYNTFTMYSYLKIPVKPFFSRIFMDINHHKRQKMGFISVPPCKNHTSKFHKTFCYILPVAVAQFSSDGNVIFMNFRLFRCRYVFINNGSNRPDRQNQRRRVSPSSPGGGTGCTTSAISDCILLSTHADRQGVDIHLIHRSHQ